MRCVETGKYSWKNDSPGGCDYLRPLVKSSKKDTSEAVLAAVRRFEAERDALVPLTVTVGDMKVTVKYTVQPSMHDGANIKVITLHCTLNT